MIDPVERFLNYLTVEKGLSANTLEAYKRDINKFRKHIDNTGTSITSFKRADIVSYINLLRDSGIRLLLLPEILLQSGDCAGFFLLKGLSGRTLLRTSLRLRDGRKFQGLSDLKRSLICLKNLKAKHFLSGTGQCLK
jgi:hypothetical protein